MVCKYDNHGYDKTRVCNNIFYSWQVLRALDKPIAMACFRFETFFPPCIFRSWRLYSFITFLIFPCVHCFTDFFIYSPTHTFFLMKQKLLFAEEGAVYNLVGTADRGYISKLPLFDTTQAIDIPKDWIYFPQLPKEINEQIYYYCFLLAVKERNFESAYYYATHVSEFITKKIYRSWFENPALDIDFDSTADLKIMYAEIRCYITFASLIFDVYSERSEEQYVYPIMLEFNSRFRRRTNPITLCRIPDPCCFVDNYINFNLVEMEEPALFASRPGTVYESIDVVNIFGQDSDEENAVFETFQAPILQNLNLLEFRKGPLNGDYCLVDGKSVDSAILEVNKLIHPCVFMELFDCCDDTWVNLENYTSIQNSPVWKKFQAFLQYSIDPNLGLFFRVAPTNTFVTLE